MTKIPQYRYLTFVEKMERVIFLLQAYVKSGKSHIGLTKQSLANLFNSLGYQYSYEDIRLIIASLIKNDILEERAGYFGRVKYFLKQSFIDKTKKAEAERLNKKEERVNEIISNIYSVGKIDE